MPGRSEPVEIPRGSEALFMLQRIRDEAHRFANTFHGERRSKRMTRSALDGIAGLGETRKKRLAQGARRRQRRQGGVLGAPAGADVAARRRRRRRPRQAPSREAIVTDETVDAAGSHHAAWWIEGFTDGADPEYEEQILPLAAAELAGAHAGARRRLRRRSDQPAGGGDSTGVELAVGVDPTWNQITRRRRSRAGRPASCGRRADRLPFADGAFDAVVACLVFEHIDAVDEAIAEVARVLEPGGRFCFFLNHPLLQTPDSGWIDDHMRRPARAVLADRAVPARRRRRSRRSSSASTSASSTARCPRYVNALAANGLFVERMVEPAPPPGLPGAGARVRRGGDGAAPAVPAHRRSVLSSRTGGLSSLAPVAEIVLITGMSGAGRSAAADVLEDLGWYVVDNLPTSLVEKIVELASIPGSGIDRLALVAGRNYGAVLDNVAALRAAGHRVTVLFLDAYDAELVRRYDATRRKHPLAAESRRARRVDRAGAGAAATHPRRRRPRHRHQRAEHPPAQAPARRRVRRRRRRRSCRWPSRASASSTGCRSTPTS